MRMLEPTEVAVPGCRHHEFDREKLPGRIVSKLGDLGLADKSTNTTSDVTRSPAAQQLVSCTMLYHPKSRGFINHDICVTMCDYV